MNITGSFQTQAVRPEWFTELVMELDGAIKASGIHIAPGSRYNPMSLESDKPTPVGDLEIRQWNARNIEIALTNGDQHARLKVERGSRYGIRVVTLNGETNATSRWKRTVWKGSLDVEKWFNGHHGALTGDVNHRAGIVQ